MKNIGVVGLWHLGCVLCAVWSKLGNRVTGFDHDAKRVAALRGGAPPLFEPGLAEAIGSQTARGFLDFSPSMDALAECDFVFVSYDTPVLDDDSSDVSILERSVQDLSGILRKDAIVVVSSQSPVGLCRRLRDSLRAKNPDAELAYSPENLRLGEAIRCYENPGRIILGTANAETDRRCREFFSQIPAEILSMNLESAETVKHGINSFLATSIVFADRLADICELTGARIDDVVRGMKSDPRIGPKAYLSPGIGFSGGTLGRDLVVLGKVNKQAAGDADSFFEYVHRANAGRKHAIVRRTERLLGSPAGRTVCVLGVTYKPGTSTLRRSLPLEIVDLLMARGCRVRVYDPKADYSELGRQSKFQVAADLAEAAKDADLAMLLTEWPQFKQCDWRGIPALMRRAIMYDTKNFLDETEMRTLGFEYHSAGRS